MAQKKILDHNCQIITSKLRIDSLDLDFKYTYYYSNKYKSYPIKSDCIDTLSKLNDMQIVGWEFENSSTGNFKYIPISIEEKKLSDDIF